MPVSQLKQLKASLREQGLVGPQRSKKERAKARKSTTARDSRVQRDAALDGIRERFNPFDAKAPARATKHHVVDARGPSRPPAMVRPGVTKSLREDARRQAVRAEAQQRLKVGGLLDRRFGENDPTMTPEERALERFVREKQRVNRKKAVFDLEDDSEGDGGGLTHLGQSLGTNDAHGLDDLEDDPSDEDADLMGERRGGKRQRRSDPEDDAPAQSKSRNEVMQEVIAKSKLHKYERQKAKEEDEDLRAELDTELKDVNKLMRKSQASANRHMDVDVAQRPLEIANATPTTSNGAAGPDRQYDEQVRQMALDARSKPTERTKTEEELAAARAEHLESLEQQRLQRMRPEANGAEKLEADDAVSDEDLDPVGLGPGLSAAKISSRPAGIDDEDDFELDADLQASGSELEDQDSSQLSSGSEHVADEESSNNEFVQPAPTGLQHGDSVHGDSGLPFTYPCPATHQEWIEITRESSLEELPTIVQRIRALYHPKLAEENKAKLALFSSILVEHLSYLADQSGFPPFTTLEPLIRHIHSLAKTFPTHVGRAFRAHLNVIGASRPTALKDGDIVVLTAIGTIFPTSDHFHQVATPAMLAMTRYLGLAPQRKVSDIAKRTFVGTVCLQYQTLAKRYVPELVNHALSSISILAPTKSAAPFGDHPFFDAADELRIHASLKARERSSEVRLQAAMMREDTDIDPGDTDTKLDLLRINLKLTDKMAELWQEKSAFVEIFQPFERALEHLSGRSCVRRLPKETNDAVAATLAGVRARLATARQARRPLALHHHRPLPIKTAVPRFEAGFDPARRHDPDAARAAHRKLAAAHRQERRGALRELRRDAGLRAREQARERAARDAAYDRRFRRLVAEIQGEEGREAKAYEREKRLRKGKR